MIEVVNISLTEGHEELFPPPCTEAESEHSVLLSDRTRIDRSQVKPHVQSK